MTSNQPGPSLSRSAVVFVSLAIGMGIGYALPRPVAAPDTPPTPAAVPSAPEPARVVTARVFAVESIADGDTFRIMHSGESTKPRISNIDTPKRGHPDYDWAMAALRELIGDREVTIAFTNP